MLSAAKGLAAIVLSWGDRPIDGFSTTELLGVINQVSPQAYSAILDEPSVVFLVFYCVPSVVFCLFRSVLFTLRGLLTDTHLITHLPTHSLT